MSELVLGGIGMATSLGGVVHGSAAQRAGLARPTEIHGFDAPDEDEGALPVIGHRAYPECDGFTQVGKWVRLVSLAVEDLLAQAELAADDAAFAERTLLVGSAPILEHDRFRWPAELVHDALHVHWLGATARLCGFAIPPDRTMCFAEGHTGVARALAHARAEFEAGRADRALVISADSYLDSGSLDWLLAEDRLKSGDNPVGLAPGEAGAALLVETREACAARGGTPLAVLPLVTVLAAPSPNGERSARDDEDVAVRLAEVLGAATGAHSERFDGDLFVDLNGEVWKSRVWGSAQPRLHETIDWETARTVFPIVELGETGAATAAVSLCLGVRSFARRYARSDRALVCSIADDGAVAAIVLAGAD